MKKIWLAMGLLALCAALSGCAIVPAPETPRQEEKVLLTVLAGESTSDPGMADLIHERIEKAFPNVELEWVVLTGDEEIAVRERRVMWNCFLTGRRAYDRTEA